MPGFLEGDPGRYLLRIRDLNGRLHGLGFVADPQGGVLTAHESVAGLDRVVLHTPGGQTRVLGPDAVLPLPGHGLALLRTEAVGGLPVPPLPLAAVAAGHEVLLPALAGEDGRVVALRCGLLGVTGAAYGGHRLGEVLLLDVPVVGGVAVPAGSPVLDARSGAVVALAAPALRDPRHGGALPAVAVGAGPADGTAAAGVLAGLLASNAAAVPGYGPALNLAGVLRLTAAQVTAAGAGPARVADLAADRVDRPDGLAGDEPAATVTALVGAPGSGRTTELAALAARRHGGAHPLPTLWLRGADLRAGDRSLAEPLERALAAAAAGLGTPAPAPEPVAALCAAAGRPLLVVLDGPEEAPLAVDARWLRGAGQWLTGCGARLVTACGEELWERLAAETWGSGTPGPRRTAEPQPDGDLGSAPTVRMDGRGPDGPSLAGQRLGPLPPEAAERVRRRYGLPPGHPAAAGDGGHPLAVRLAGELWAQGLRDGPVRRGELFDAFLDLRCLRVAQRLAEDGRPRRPGAHRRGAVRPAGPRHRRVRRLAAAVAGRVHEAARRMLGGRSGGGLDRAAFEELFPVEGGWATAVLAEGLFVPAGPGFRFAHGEFADWLQGRHLDLDAALRLLLGEAEDTPPWPADEPAEPGGHPAAETAETAAGADAVPRHRIGPVAAALRRVAETWGAGALDPWLHRIWRALDLRPPGSEPAWWAARLLAEGLAAGPDPAEHRALLDQMAARIAERAGGTGAVALAAAGLGRFGPAFWTGLGLPVEAELALLRSLVAADGPGQRFLAVVAQRLRADPVGVFPLLCAWFEDPRGLPGRPGRTVADLAHDLLYAHRRLALDELADALAAAAHPRADALLTVLAAEEPSALCRAVDRWSHDRRPERHVAAAVHALRTAPYASGAGVELLRYTALTLLAREDEPGLHGAALALLVGDPATRAEHLPAALALLRAGGDAFLTPRALAPALESDPEPVLVAFAECSAAPGAAPAETLRVLADATAPAAVRRGAELAAGLLRGNPGLAGPVAVDYLGRRLARAAAGPADRLELRVLIGAALAARSAAVRRPFAEVLSVPVADPAADALRCELLDTLLAAETDPAVLTVAVERLAEHCAAENPARARAVLARAGTGLPGADELLVRCAGRSAAFARLLARWPSGAAPTAPDGPRLARMRALAAAGRDPQYAAAEAERAVSGRAAGPSAGSTRIPVPEPGQAHGTL
ncbi:serine protease [Kitasatospora sp. NPDC056800]|uniref:serine protease n=1 Tax=Kitasatospora sp. NPDC056800 TaxID=3345948 RepID=UPI0036C81E37